MLKNFLEYNDFWQYLPNLAPSGNTADTRVDSLKLAKLHKN